MTASSMQAGTWAMLILLFSGCTSGQLARDIKQGIAQEIASSARPEEYQEAGQFIPTPGYADRQLGPDTYEIGAQGHPYTTEGRLVDLAMARAGELAVKAGYSHFAVLESRKSANCQVVKFRASGRQIGPADPATQKLFLRVHFSRAKVDARYMVAKEQFDARLTAIRTRPSTPSERLAAYAAFDADCNRQGLGTHAPPPTPPVHAAK